ncbi:MAG TPA: bacteriohemerythrin [Candidatus Aquicultor sp.]|jgi:hemerythrin
MAIAKWTDELKTGVSDVDKQHKELINLINNLHDALIQGKGKERVEEALTFLSNYVVEHFKCEEDLMLKHNYTGFPAHKREHERFVYDVTALANDFKQTANPSFLAITLQKSIVDWLVNHILKVDKEMAKFIIEKTGGRAA